MTLGSALIPLLIGLALGDLLHGLPINRNQTYTGSFWSLFTGYGVYTGVTVVGLCLLLGASFLSLKTVGPLHERARRLTRGLSYVAGPLVVGFAIWSGLIAGRGVGPNIFGAVAAVAVLVSAALAGTNREGLTFAAAAVGMGATVSTIFAQLYSNVMVSSTSSAFNITIGNAASASYTLTVLTIAACIFAPLVLAYQGWSYYVFRKRLLAPRAEVPRDQVDTSRLVEPNRAAPGVPQPERG
jgi:cytochrome d ubiquinol oxidase subunit II